MKTSFIKRAVGSSENLRGWGRASNNPGPVELEEKGFASKVKIWRRYCVLKWILRGHLKPPLNATI